jgi:hypothetical protein
MRQQAGAASRRAVCWAPRDDRGEGSGGVLGVGRWSAGDHPLLGAVARSSLLHSCAGRAQRGQASAVRSAGHQQHGMQGGQGDAMGSGATTCLLARASMAAPWHGPPAPRKQVACWLSGRRCAPLCARAAHCPAAAAAPLLLTAAWLGARGCSGLCTGRMAAAEHDGWAARLCRRCAACAHLPQGRSLRLLAPLAPCCWPPTLLLPSIQGSPGCCSPLLPPCCALLGGRCRGRSLAIASRACRRQRRLGYSGAACAQRCRAPLWCTALRSADALSAGGMQVPGASAPTEGSGAAAWPRGAHVRRRTRGALGGMHVCARMAA